MINVCAIWKLLEENIEVNLCEFRLANDLLAMIPRGKITKEKIGLHQIKSFGLQRYHEEKDNPQNERKYL